MDPEFCDSSSMPLVFYFVQVLWFSSVNSVELSVLVMLFGIV